MNEWVGVDLDATLAEYNNTGDWLDIGKPIPLMLARVIRWLHEGKEVRIVTARVNSEGNKAGVDKQRAAIEKWCKKYLGKTLPITCKKSHNMTQLWDDRAVQVIPNTGSQVLALDGQLFAADPEDLHCSDHSFFSSGCNHCQTTALFSSYIQEAGELTKAAPRLGIHALEITPERPSPKIQLIKNQMERKIYIFLQNAASDAAVSLRKSFVKKAEDDKKIKEAEEAFLIAYAAIQWQELVDQVYSDLYEIALVAAKDGHAQLENIAELNSDNVAEDYAKKRIADMVGEGTHYSIATTTKESLQSMARVGAEFSATENDLANAIKTSAIFSRGRAELIANTETVMAMVAPHLEMWKLSGKVKSVNVVLSSEHVIVDECDDHASGSPYLIDEVPMIPAHPYCMCSIVVHELNQ